MVWNVHESWCGLQFVYSISFTLICAFPFNIFLDRLVFLLKCDRSGGQWLFFWVWFACWFHWYVGWWCLDGLCVCRETFIALCLEFQKDIDKGEHDELRALLSEKEFLEGEVLQLDKRNNTLKSSMLAFVDEILGDLHSSNSGTRSFPFFCYIYSLFSVSHITCKSCGQVFYCVNYMVSICQLDKHLSTSKIP